MLLNRCIFLCRRVFFSLFYRWLFGYFDYLIFLAYSRVSMVITYKIKLLCQEYKLFSNFFSSKKFSVTFFNNATPWFSSLGLVIFSTTIFSNNFLKALVVITAAKQGAVILSVLLNGYFLNPVEKALDKFFLFVDQKVSILIFLFVNAFFFSNFLWALLHGFTKEENFPINI